MSGLTVAHKERMPGYRRSCRCLFLLFGSRLQLEVEFQVAELEIIAIDAMLVPVFLLVQAFAELPLLLFGRLTFR